MRFSICPWVCSGQASRAGFLRLGAYCSLLDIPSGRDKIFNHGAFRLISSSLQTLSLDMDPDTQATSNGAVFWSLANSSLYENFRSVSMEKDVRGGSLEDWSDATSFLASSWTKSWKAWLNCGCDFMVRKALSSLFLPIWSLSRNMCQISGRVSKVY